VTGAASVEVVSLDVVAAEVDVDVLELLALLELLACDEWTTVVLPDEQPAISAVLTTTAANNDRLAM
jgi:hypothetical protein